MEGCCLCHGLTLEETYRVQEMREKLLDEIDEWKLQNLLLDCTQRMTGLQVLDVSVCSMEQNPERNVEPCRPSRRRSMRIRDSLQERLSERAKEQIIDTASKDAKKSL